MDIAYLIIEYFGVLSNPSIYRRVIIMAAAPPSRLVTPSP